MPRAVKTRELSKEEAKTWTSYGGGAGGPLANGYDLPGPAILIGNPQNNPVLAVVAQPGKWHPDSPGLMPYTPSQLVPGPGRAMIGWQFYPLGRRLETVALVANDAQGLAEGVGTLLEIVAGLEPLTPAILAGHEPHRRGQQAGPQAGRAGRCLAGGACPIAPCRSRATAVRSP